MDSIAEDEFVSSHLFPVTSGPAQSRGLAGARLSGGRSSGGLAGVGQGHVWFVKRALDLLFAAIGLILAAPLLLLAAISIRLDSRGAALYRQRRLGFRGRSFELFKLRSMYVDANLAPDGGRWTQVDDPRVTRVGRLLRRYRVDELPQLWNVLCGEMSLVGPRPEQVPIAERLTTIAPEYRLRHLVRPGITGLAQVNTGYGATENASLKKLTFDLDYVRRVSLMLDIQIVCRTVAVVLTGRGAR